MPKPHDILLSYSNDAGQLPEMVRFFFKGKFDFDVYLYNRDLSGHGSDLREHLSELVRVSRHVLVLITDEAIGSKWVEWEIEAARRNNVHLIGLKFTGIRDERVPTTLRAGKLLTYSTSEELLDKLSQQPWGLIDVYLPAAGFGGSGEFSQEVPKVLYPLAEKPMLFHVLNSLASPEIRRVNIINRTACDYIDYISRLHTFGFEIERQHTNENYPQALKNLDPKSTFVVQLCDVLLHRGEANGRLRTDWQKALRRHREFKDANPSYLGTLIVSKHYKLAVGTVTLDREELVTGVKENPVVRNVFDLYFNTGTAILEPELLEHVKSTDTSLLEGAIDRANKASAQFGAYIWGEWDHILNLNDYRNLNEQFGRQ